MKSPIGRDFKRGAATGGITALRGSREARKGFALGLAVGLAVAVGVFGWAQLQLRQSADDDPDQPVPRQAAPTAAGAADAAASGTDGQFDFYDRLKNQEVVIPEQERTAAAGQPTSVIDRPGVYVLQPGAYRDAAEAERLRARLARLGVQAVIQRVAIDADEFHRVRVGPYEDLKELNAMRAKLRAADIDALVIRIGD